MTILCIAVLLCCWLKLSVALITLEPVDITPLEQQTSEQISVALRFDPLTVAAEDVNESEVCILINGNICHCFSDTFKDTRLFLVPSCLHAIAEPCANKGAAHCQYWFALQLTHPSTKGSPKRSIVTSAINVAPQHDVESQITLVLPLTLDDLSRSAVLLNTLTHIPPDTVHELLVFVPNSQQRLIEAALLGIVQSLGLRFPAVVHPESMLFTAGASAVRRVFPYAIQMSVKLLAAQLVRTSHYITLDADVVLLRPLTMDLLIYQENKAIYHFEERTVHANWWTGSELLLNISPESSYKYHTWRQRELCSSAEESCSRQFGATQAEEQGFGVTPVVMSTYGSLLTVAHLCRQLAQHYEPYTDGDTNNNRARRIECERLWLEGFGRQYTTVDESGAQTMSPTVMLWSEYTLYRVVLDHLQVYF